MTEQTIKIPGIHHVTAIAGNAWTNLDFYTRALGLRLVKKTVNFDDPFTYHLYYGDELGRPGTIMTFFPFQGVARGRTGVGLGQSTSFAVPAGSLEFWAERLAELAIEHEPAERRFDEKYLRLHDVDGLQLELVESVVPAVEESGNRAHAGIPAEHAITGFHGVSLLVRDPEPSARLLADIFGYTWVGEEGGRVRLVGDMSVPGAALDLVRSPGTSAGRMGSGSMHHVAFRARNDEEQLEWRERVESAGIPVTPVRDRNYFRSIYFHEPGGVLFEIATDPPGFTVDETPEKLGSELRLPPWLESRRELIEGRLPELHVAVGKES